MIEIKNTQAESIVVKLGDRPELYRVIPRQQVTVRTERALYKLHNEMQEAQRAGDLDLALTKMLHTVLLFSDIPLEVLEDLTMDELNQLMGAFNGNFPQPETTTET